MRVVGGVGGVRKADALEPPFTGRHEELRLIKDLLHATGREKKPRLASVVGTGGIGKSRLVWELFKYVDGLSETIWWHVGRSPSYGEGVAFWALAEMVRMRAGIAETDGEEVAKEKLDVCLVRYFPHPEEIQWLRPSLAQLLGFEERNEDSQEGLFAAWRTFFERIAEDGTVILVFEDLHWADPGLIDFIEHVMASARTSPIFLLTLARPELTDRHTTWGSGQRNFVNIHLDRLDDEDMVLLMKGIANDLPETVRGEIVERAEGVPLYAVEMVRMLIDRNSLVPQGSGYNWVGGDRHVDVPDSLHSLIASRLDALPGEDRLLVQDASVLGKTFTLGALATVSSVASDELEPRLEELARKEILLVHRDPRSPERGQYGFVQSLIAEVAYQTLANRDRRERHLKAATYFESLEEPDLIDVIATHYVEAYNNSPKDEEAEELARRALESLREAAKRARSLGSHEQALALSEKALSIATDDTDRAQLLLEGGQAGTASGQLDKAISLLRESVELLAGMGRSSLLGTARSALGNAYFVSARMDEAEQMLLEAVDDWEDPETDPSAGAVYSELARVYVFKGDFEKSDAYSTLAMRPAERAGDLPVIIDTLITRAVSSLVSHRVHEAEALLVGALKLARDHGLVQQQLRALINTSANQMQMHPRLALETSKEGLAIAQRYGHRAAEAFLTSNGLEAGVYLAEWDWVRCLVTDVSDRLGDLTYIVLPGRVFFEAYQGNLEEARRLIAELEPTIKDSISQQDQFALAASKAITAFMEGDFESVLAEVRLDHLVVGESSLDLFALHGRAAVWARNLDEAHAAKRRMDGMTMRNELTESFRITLAAGVVFLEGATEEASDLYRSALAGWKALEIPTYVALCQMDMALLLDGPEAEEASAAAEAFFTEAGNLHLVRRLQEATG
ncbi:MAG: ATP-binding protein [Actinomycetota bacterium]